MFTGEINVCGHIISKINARDRIWDVRKPPGSGEEACIFHRTDRDCLGVLPTSAHPMPVYISNMPCGSPVFVPLVSSIQCIGIAQLTV